MYEVLKVKIVGVAPLIMHNIQLADPANRFVREIKRITNKKKQMTEADHIEKNRLEFLGGLYMGENGPILPADMIEGVIISGAKKSSKGPQAKAGIVVEKHADVIYDGTRDPNELFADDDHRLTRMARVGQSKVTRTRPIFNSWAANLEVKYLPEIINREDIMEALRNGGMLCAVGDWRPRYGRFEVIAEIQQALPVAA